MRRSFSSAIIHKKMKRRTLTVATACLLLASTGLTSCLGSFELTNKLLAWNKTIDNKFVNEVVFIALWIVPAYEVAGFADLLVLNSIEFWSGESALAQAPKVIEGNDGKYLVESDRKGYTITSLNDRSKVRLDFDSNSRTWSIEGTSGKTYPLVTFVDESFLKVNIGGGETILVENTPESLYALHQAVDNQTNLFAAR